MSNYISVHVRSGDKLAKEARPVPLQKYIHTIERKMLMKNSSRNIFAFSDDPSAIEEFRQLKPAWNFFVYTMIIVTEHSDIVMINLISIIYQQKKKFIKPVVLCVNYKC